MIQALALSNIAAARSGAVLANAIRHSAIAVAPKNGTGEIRSSMAFIGIPALAWSPGPQPLHPEHAVARRSLDRGVEAGRDAQSKHAPRVGRVDDAVVPQAGGGIPWAALGFVLLADRGLERVLFLGAPAAAAGLDAVALHRGQHAGRLLAAHHADPRVRPHPQEAAAVGAAVHGVVAGAEAAADDHGELGHVRARDRGDHLRAVAGDAGLLVLLADHEAGDVLQEHQRDAALVAQLDEMRALERAFGEQDAVVGDDPDRIAVQVGEAAHQGLAVARLELLQLAAVDDARD